MPKQLFIGLMSGTSVDAIDAVLFDATSNRCIDGYSIPFSSNMRSAIQALMSAGHNEIERLGALDRELGYAYAEAVLQLLHCTQTDADSVAAIGSHGQTVRHHPQRGDKRAFTLQIGDPNTIAEVTGITTIADFRRRDIAAGGEGAPLVPAFHQAVFAKPDRQRAIVNLGGIANVTLLDSETLLEGFDTGPGNTLMDLWHQQHRGGSYDRDGAWAAEGRVDDALLEQLLAEPFFQRRGPRSTGRELFNLAWLNAQLENQGALRPIDVQATLTELTASAIAAAIAAKENFAPQELLLCGGGAYNRELSRRIRNRMPSVSVQTTDIDGIAPEWVEASAFAWLAAQTVSGLAGNAPAATGAAGLRVLGGIYPGSAGLRWI